MIYKGSALASFSSKGVIEKTLIKNLSGQTVGETYITDEPDILQSETYTITEWTRPAAWPNLDNLTIPSDFEGVYLTYDNTLDRQDSWAGFYCDMSGGTTYTVSIGHMNGNNWVEDVVKNATKNTYLQFNYKDLNLNYDYLVFKVVPTSSSYHFTRFGFGYIPTSITGQIVNFYSYLQHCIERKGRLPYITSTTNSSSNYTYATGMMEYDNTIIGESNTGSISLASAFIYAYRLQKVNLNWPVNQWNITSLQNMFYQCFKLEDLSQLNSWAPYTTNWHVTALASMFYCCYNLKKCGVFKWDISHWGNTSTRAITFDNMFNGCQSLDIIDLSNWDTSQLKVSTIYSMFASCYSAKKIKIDNWITTNWTITRLDGVFNSCYSLLDLNLSNWNLSNCIITRTDNMFSSCYKIRDLSFLEGWDVSNWRVTQINGMFNACRKITSLNLNNWDTSEWSVTRIDYLFSNCNNLRNLQVGSWDTSNWAVTNISYLLPSCYLLKEFTGFNWDTSNWPVTTFNQMFYWCCSLKEINFTKWNTSKFDIQNVSATYFSGYCYSMEKFDLSNLDFANITTVSNTGNNSSAGMFYCAYSLKEAKLPQNYKGYLYLNHSNCMDKEHIIFLLNQLKQTSTAIAINIGAQRTKLTATDIAIATAKGYTVS